LFLFYFSLFASLQKITLRDLPTACYPSSKPTDKLAGLNEKWDARINKLVQQQDAKYDAKFEALESKIKKEIEELTSKTAALDAKLSASSNVSNFGGPAVSVASALPSPSIGPAGVTPFVPTKVEVKGWIVPSKGWEQDREEQGLLEVEVGAWLDELFRRLSAEAKECINAEATRAKNRRAISSLVALRLRTDGLDARAAEQRARLVKSAIDQAIAEAGDGLKVKGRAPRCTMEGPTVEETVFECWWEGPRSTPAPRGTSCGAQA
jgi:hypothetical protein